MKPIFAPNAIPAMPRPLRMLIAAVLAIAGFITALAFAAFMFAAASAFWLSSTSGGQHWLSTQLSTLTADSGYRIEIGRIHALGASTIGIDAIGVYQGDTPVVLIQKAAVAPSIARFLNDEISLSLRARAVLLYAQETSAPSSQPAKIIPDAQTLNTVLQGIAYKKFSINNIDVEQLALMQSDGTPSFIINPDMQASAEITDTGVDASISGSIIGLLEDQSPLEFDTKASLLLSGDTPALLVDKLSLNGADWAQDATATLQLPRTPEDTTPLALTVNAPLKDNQALDITANIVQSPAFQVQDIKVDAPGATAKGQLAQNDIGKWSGALDIKADLDLLAEYIPHIASLELQKNLEVSLSFEGNSLTLTAPRLTYQEIAMRDVSVKTTPLDDLPASSRSIALSLREESSGTKINATTDLVFDVTGQQWQLQKLDVDVSAAKAGSVAAIGNIDQSTIDLTITTNKFRPDLLIGILDAGDIPPLRLDDMKLIVQGTLAAPTLTLDGVVTPASLPKGSPAVSAAVKANLANGLLDARATLRSRALTSGGITLQQPVTLSLYPFTFDIASNGLDAAASLRGNLNALGGFMPVGLTTSGDIKLAALATGSLKAPQASGTLQLNNGRLRDAGTGIALQNITLDGRFDNDDTIINSLSARDNKRGRLQGSGRLKLTPGHWPIDAQLKLTDIDPFTRSASAISSMPVVDGVLDADLKLGGNATRYLLAGTMGSDRLDITLPATFISSVPQLNIVEEGRARGAKTVGLASLALDIAVNIPQKIFVRGWGLDAEFGGKLQLGGTAETPIANGALQSLRGRYEEFGRRFTLARAKLDFRGAIPPSPYLDIIAETEVDGITAQVVLGGSATQPKITFTSDPPLPQEDVLSRILFGRERASISPTQALQMAQTLRRFSGGGQGLDPLGRLRSGIGLDDLSVDSDEDGGTSVGAGKYLSDEVYLEVGGGEKGGAAKVQIELTPNVKVESKVGQDAGAGGGIFWEWEY